MPSSSVGQLDFDAADSGVYCEDIVRLLAGCRVVDRFDGSSSFCQDQSRPEVALCEAAHRSATMAGSMQRGRHSVHGFGRHVHMKTVEFMDKLECGQVCSWCGSVCLEMFRLNCQHVICELCKSTHTSWDSCYRSYGIECCGVNMVPPQLKLNAGHTGDKRVRCINADSGCHFVGPLRDLDEHLRQSCALYPATCSKCGDTVAHKDMRSHYPACSGRPGVFLRTSDARSLLDNLGAACEKLEQAVASAGANDRDALRDTVSLVREQFARINAQLDTGAPYHIRKCSVPRLGK